MNGLDRVRRISHQAAARRREYQSGFGSWAESKDVDAPGRKLERADDVLGEFLINTRCRRPDGLYAEYIGKDIRPVLGSLPLTRLDVEILDSFCAELRRCREHCDGRPQLQHRTSQPHRCDEHETAPCASPTPVAATHAGVPADHTYVARRGLDRPADSWILSGALDRAVVWQWISVNPAEHASKPPLGHPDLRPPTAEEAARLVERAWSKDPDFPGVR